MPLAEFKDLCIDAADSGVIARFYAELLGLNIQILDDGNAMLTGPTPQHRIWVNTTPEPHSAKNRMHVDIALASVQRAVDLGGKVQHELESWSVLTDPEGGEFCVLHTPDGAAPGAVIDVVIDSTHPGAQAEWWAKVLGGSVDVDTGAGLATLSPIAGAPFRSLDFVAVPEPKTVKNRVHLDVIASAVEPILDAGATLLQAKGHGLGWTVLADPEGNEFCVFTS